MPVLSKVSTSAYAKESVSPAADLARLISATKALKETLRPAKETKPCVPANSSG
jgi:hypothetical protein